MEAQLVLGLADRFGCAPDDAYRMDARVLRLLDTERRLKGGEEPGGW